MEDRAMPYLTPADLLSAGLNLPALDIPPVTVPAGMHCSITGQPIAAGYRVADMVTEATAEYLDCFRGGTEGWVSEAAARCFKAANPRKGNLVARSVLVFDGEPAHLPLIDHIEAHKQDRPCWSELVRQVWPSYAGRHCLIILTTDTKKRLWIRARVGALGPMTPALYYDGKTAGNQVLMLDWPKMIDCLDLIEVIYALGFPKAAISENLLLVYTIAVRIGITKTLAWEEELVSWRERPEFQFALLIAQKGA